MYIGVQYKSQIGAGAGLTCATACASSFCGKCVYLRPLFMDYPVASDRWGTRNNNDDEENNA